MQTILVVISYYYTHAAELSNWSSSSIIIQFRSFQAQILDYF